MSLQLAAPNSSSVLDNATNNSAPSSPLNVAVANGGGGGGVAGSLAQEGSSPTGNAGKQPSWWEKLLPTAGGVLGGLVGSVGDLAGPLGLATTTGGAALGGSLGQALENDLTGKKVLEGNDLVSGAENGAGNLVGAGIAKGIGAAGGALIKPLGNAVADRAAQAETDTAEKAAQDEISRVGNEFKLQSNDKNLTPHIKDTVQTLRDIGYSNPTAQDAKNVGNVLTGSNENGPGIINQEKQAILGSAGGKVNIGQLGDETTPSGQLLKQLRDPTVQSELGDPLDPKGQSAASAILSKYNLLANGAGIPAEGAGTITPESGFNLLSKVSDESRAATINANRPAATTADTAKANVWNNLKNGLKTAVYDRPEVNDAVANYQTTPELESQIDKKIAAEGITDPNVAANLKEGIIQTLNGKSNMQDWLTAESRGVNMSKIGSSALKQQGDLTAASTQRLAKGEVGEASSGEPDMQPTKGKGGKLLDTVSVGAAPFTHGASLIGMAPHVVTAVKDPAVQEAAYKGLTKFTSSKVAQKVIPTLMRTGAIMGANVPNVAAASQSAIPLSNDQSQGASVNPTQSAAVNPLATLYSQLEGQAASPTGIGGNLVSTLNTIAPLVQKQQLAANALSSLPSAYQNAGGAQGPLGGIVNSIIGKLVPGSAQNTYQQQSLAVAAQLATALGISLPQAQAMLTSMAQTPASANVSQANETGLLNMLTVPTQ